MEYYRQALMLQPWMVELRRHLHRNPELSGREYETMRYVAGQLDALGVSWVEVENGGVLGAIGKPGDGRPTLLLRADMDALPINESKTNLRGAKNCVSQTPGVCHACGHDLHTATLLGVARLLKGRQAALGGNVILCFERGEEQCTGVESILRYLEGQPYAIDACYAAHVQAGLASGLVSVQPGVVMAGGGGFRVRLHGQGGHGSRPDMANSPIDCFAAFHSALQGLRLREADPFTTLTYSVGMLQAGDSGNVIPDTLDFAGTMRSLDIAGAGDRIVEVFRRLLEGVCAGYNCRPELAFSKPLYEVNNHPACAALAQRVVRETLGPQALAEMPPWMASESMGLYQKLWPGVLAFVGIRDAEKGCGAAHHNAAFDADEDALAIGCAVMVGFVEGFMKQQPDVSFNRSIRSFEDLVTRSIR